MLYRCVYDYSDYLYCLWDRSYWQISSWSKASLLLLVRAIKPPSIQHHTMVFVIIHENYYYYCLYGRRCFQTLLIKTLLHSSDNKSSWCLSQGVISDDESIFSCLTNIFHRNNVKRVEKHQFCQVYPILWIANRFCYFLSCFLFLA